MNPLAAEESMPYQASLLNVEWACVLRSPFDLLQTEFCCVEKSPFAMEDLP